MKIRILIFLINTGCSFPKDPKESFEQALQDSLKVGIVDNPPYTFKENGDFEGSEVEI
jgi:hypothetical protein